MLWRQLYLQNTQNMQNYPISRSYEMKVRNIFLHVDCTVWKLPATHKPAIISSGTRSRKYESAYAVRKKGILQFLLFLQRNTESPKP